MEETKNNVQNNELKAVTFWQTNNVAKTELKKYKTYSLLSNALFVISLLLLILCPCTIEQTNYGGYLSFSATDFISLGITENEPLLIFSGLLEVGVPIVTIIMLILASTPILKLGKEPSANVNFYDRLVSLIKNYAKEKDTAFYLALSWIFWSFIYGAGYRAFIEAMMVESISWGVIILLIITASILRVKRNKSCNLIKDQITIEEFYEGKNE